MNRLDQSLRQAAAQQPAEPFDVIVRVQGDLETRRQALEEQGLQIRRHLPLVKGFAVTVPGAQVHALAALPWVISVEPDRPVRALKRPEAE